MAYFNFAIFRIVLNTICIMFCFFYQAKTQNVILDPTFSIVSNYKVDQPIQLVHWDGNFFTKHTCGDSSKYEAYSKTRKNKWHIVFQGFRYDDPHIPKNGHGTALFSIFPKSDKWNSATGQHFMKGNLVAPLKSSQLYYFHFYVKRSHDRAMKTNGVWVYCSEKVIDPIKYADINGINLFWDEKIEKHDEWEKREGYFRAKGGEKYINIASLHDPNLFKRGWRWNKQRNAAGYCIDDLYLTPVDEDSIPIKWDAPALHPLKESLIQGGVGTKLVIDTLLFDSAGNNYIDMRAGYFPQLGQISLALLEDEGLNIRIDFIKNYDDDFKEKNYNFIRRGDHKLKQIRDYIVERSRPSAKHRIEIGGFIEVDEIGPVKKDKYPYLLITGTK